MYDQTKRRKPIIDRFWPKVTKTDGCWLWTGARTHGGTGYGLIGSSGKRGPLVYAHRFSYLIHHGDPTGFDVLHKCDNPRCVNPDHLFLGTAADNARDMVNKHRGTAKLSLEQVREIRKLCNETVKGKRARAKLAERFGVTYTAISYVVARKTFKHVT